MPNFTICSHIGAITSVQPLLALEGSPISMKSVLGIPGTWLQPTLKMLGRLGKDLKSSSSGIPSAAGGQVTWEV